jgi:hypothetical protein
MDDSESEDDRNCKDLEDVQMHGSVPNPGENVMSEAKMKKAKNNEKQRQCRVRKVEHAFGIACFQGGRRSSCYSESL